MKKLMFILAIIALLSVKLYAVDLGISIGYPALYTSGEFVDQKADITKLGTSGLHLYFEFVRAIRTGWYIGFSSDFLLLHKGDNKGIAVNLGPFLERDFFVKRKTSWKTSWYLGLKFYFPGLVTIYNFNGRRYSNPSLGAGVNVFYRFPKLFSNSLTFGTLRLKLSLDAYYMIPDLQLKDHSGIATVLWGIGIERYL